MSDDISATLSSSFFMPHGHCYLWRADILWLHVLSDSAIVLAYFAIPILLVYFILRRHDVPFSFMFVLFGAFIVLCGLTHAFEIWVIWHPDYVLQGILKAITGFVSLSTALALWILMPKLFALPSPKQMVEINAGLEAEVVRRRQVEGELRESRAELEARVDERTAQLEESNRQLQVEAQSRAETEAALRESEERFRLMANSMSQLAWMARGDGYIFWYNQRWYEYTGTTPEQMEGWGWQSVHDPAVLPDVLARWAESIATGLPFDMEFPLRGANGQFRRFLTRCLPLKNADGQVVQWFGTNTDVDELKRIEDEVRELNVTLERRVEERTAELRRSHEALERSNVELQQFAYVASHDLQTPLRAISGYAQLLQADFNGKFGAVADTYLERLVGGAERMQNLINDVLTYARVDSRARPFAPCKLSKVFNDVVEALSGSIRDAGGVVTCGELPVVVGDPSQLTQLLQNLIGNSLKYHGDASPRVEVTAEKNANEWVIAVRDNGIGIDPKYHERVFEIFRRLHTHDKYPGTGIGLAICRRIVQRHGGKIWVESVVGKGSTFFFTLKPE